MKAGDEVSPLHPLIAWTSSLLSPSLAGASRRSSSRPRCAYKDPAPSTFFDLTSLLTFARSQINFFRGRHDDALATYTTLLSYTKSAVTRNYSEKSINNILDYVSNATDIPLATMERFYQVTHTALDEAKNERLSVKTDLKLARLWLARQEWSRLSKSLKELRAYCTTDEGTDDQSKGTILLEIFALEIQMYSETGE